MKFLLDISKLFSLFRTKIGMSILSFSSELVTSVLILNFAKKSIFIIVSI
jgi:hypothetical protein